MKVYFDVKSVGGLSLDLGDLAEGLSYEELTKDINMKKILELTCLDQIGVTEDDIRVITQEEFERDFEE